MRPALDPAGELFRLSVCRLRAGQALRYRHERVRVASLPEARSPSPRGVAELKSESVAELTLDSAADLILKTPAELISYWPADLRRNPQLL